MGLIDILVVILVLIGFAYLIFSRIHNKNPEKAEQLIKFFKSDKPEININGDSIEKIYHEKREIL